jgi:hypothetical protein
MYCDGCGAPTGEAARFCSACGKAVAGLTPRPESSSSSASRLERHLPILAILWIIAAGLRFIAVAWMLLIGKVILPSILAPILSSIPGVPSWLPLGRIASSGLYLGAILVGVIAAAQLIAAWGLLERRPWGRILALIVGILALIHIPFGTALGIYTLWVLLPASPQEYASLARTA